MAYNVVIAKMGVKAGDSVAVLGPGPIGILCVHMAKMAGASNIIVFGAPGDEKRLEIAQAYGATETYVLGGSVDPKTVAAKFNEGYGFDKVVDAAGPAATLKIPWTSARRRHQQFFLPVLLSFESWRMESICLSAHQAKKAIGKALPQLTARPATEKDNAGV